MSVLNWCRRYVSLMFIAIVAVGAYILIFNENSYSRYSSLKNESNALRQQIQQAEDTLNHYRMLNQRLHNSPSETERIVREEYFYQRANEDVFIFE